MILSIPIKLTPEQVAQAFCELDDDEEAQVFIEIAKIADSWPIRGAMQWFNVGRHLRDCKCSNDLARDVVLGIWDGLQP